MFTLQDLIIKLREVFEDDHVDVEEVKKILRMYTSNISEWRQFAQFDDHKYTRNLVDIGNGKYNLMLLCWGPGMGSSIHDHQDAHCFVKMLSGSLMETRYDWPEKEGEQLRVISRTEYDKNGVSYMNGLHRMENPSHSDGAVSLHLYIPPYESCNAFDERTGKKTKCQVTFYTKFGKKIDYRGHKHGQLIEYPTTNKTICN